MNWEKLLNQEKEERVKKNIYSIAEAVANELKTQPHSFNLVSGSAGALIFFANLREAFNDNQYDDLIYELVEEVFNSLESETMDSSLTYGFAGVAFTLLYLIKKGVLDKDDFDASFFVDMDEFILQGLEQNNAHDNLELLTGNAGLAIYGFLRNNQSDEVGEGENGFRKKNIDLQLDGLEANSLKLDNGEAYQWKMTKIDNTKCVSLGIAHGFPGMVAQLSHIYDTGIEQERSGNLLKKAINGLLREENKDCDFSFDHTIEEDQTEKNRKCRLAWCYGDLGISLALMKAALSTQDQILYDKALEVARKAAKRPHNISRVNDNTICHGSLGLVQIYNRFYQLSKDVVFKEQALFWLNHGLNMADEYEGIERFHTKEPVNDKLEVRKSLGMLVGCVGAGLVLLSTISDKEPDWDIIYYMDFGKTISKNAKESIVNYKHQQ